MLCLANKLLIFHLPRIFKSRTLWKIFCSSNFFASNFRTPIFLAHPLKFFKSYRLIYSIFVRGSSFSKISPTVHSRVTQRVFNIKCYLNSTKNIWRRPNKRSAKFSNWQISNKMEYGPMVEHQHFLKKKYPECLAD